MGPNVIELRNTGDSYLVLLFLYSKISFIQ